MKYLVDSSVCLRLVNNADQLHGLTSDALRSAVDGGTTLFITAQIVTECRNVLTRPVASNGFGLSPTLATAQIRQITFACYSVDDPPGLVSLIIAFAERYQVSGRQIHDARLALTSEMMGLDGIITYNKVDFMRYTGVNALEPAEL